MDFGSAIKSGFKNCFKFTGRSSRSEFWWFYLFFVLCMIGCGVLASIVGALIGGAGSGAGTDNSGAVVGVIFGLFGLVMLVMFFPMLSLIFRRLHDSDKSAWFILLYLVPFGGLVMLVFYCLPGTQGPNPYGDDPLRPAIRAASVF